MAAGLSQHHRILPSAPPQGLQSRRRIIQLDDRLNKYAILMFLFLAHRLGSTKAISLTPRLATKIRILFNLI
jgi:hypothetical protein